MDHKTSKNGGGGQLLGLSYFSDSPYNTVDKLLGSQSYHVDGSLLLGVFLECCHPNFRHVVDISISGVNSEGHKWVFAQETLV